MEIPSLEMSHLKSNLKQINIKYELLLMATSLLVQVILKKDAGGSKSWLMIWVHTPDI